MKLVYVRLRRERQEVVRARQVNRAREKHQQRKTRPKGRAGALARGRSTLLLECAHNRLVAAKLEAQAGHDDVGIGVHAVVTGRHGPAKVVETGVRPVLQIDMQVLGPEYQIAGQCIFDAQSQDPSPVALLV